MTPQTDPDDYYACAQRAVAILSLAESGDRDAYVLGVAAAVSDPEDAAALIHGLVKLSMFLMTEPSIPAYRCREALAGVAAGIAAERAGKKST